MTEIEQKVGHEEDLVKGDQGNMLKKMEIKLPTWRIGAATPIFTSQLPRRLWDPEDGEFYRENLML